MCDVHRLSPLVARLVAAGRLAGLARQILGSEVYIHQSLALGLREVARRGRHAGR